MYVVNDKSYFDRFKFFGDETPGKKQYDFIHINFSEFLLKHYALSPSVNLKKWNWWQRNHLTPVFKSDQWKEYQNTVNDSQAPFFVDVIAARRYLELFLSFYDLDKTVSQFISFLCGGVYFNREGSDTFLSEYNLDLKSWLEMPNWDTPDRENPKQWSILELSKSVAGLNYLKQGLSRIEIFELKGR